MAKKRVFHLNKSDRAAKYWACKALAADSRICERFEFAVWRLHQMTVVDRVDHGIEWGYRRVEKTYRFLFETDEVILTIEGWIPVYFDEEGRPLGVVHPSPHNVWRPVTAEVRSWLPEPVKLTFDQDGVVLVEG